MSGGTGSLDVLLSDSDRFLVRVLPPGDHVPTASLRVELDGREAFFREQALDEGAFQYQVLLLQ